MRIAVFGANGNVGSRVVAEALSRRHRVTAVLRDAGRAARVPAGAVIRAGDASDAAQVAKLADGHDVVVAATRPASGREGDASTTMRALLEGLAGSETRLIVVGGAASLLVPGGGGTLVLDDPRFVPETVRPIARSSYEQFALCRAARDVDWTYLCPPALLEPGERTGRFRLGSDELLVDAAGRSALSMEDLAIAVVNEAEEARHRRARFTAAY
ncbi:NAD(P)-dependent oxidoreductase [Nitratireductor sp. ZSWI3]|uniref:NAD(P)-dependent oxidoreductase n=1 Tax=Nitratireductor sp. ZSWI3 TaxID=2966359 RepID=UPI00214F72F1|nr:NAD(P)H-binding protein [Nitratireductor sp. ZSWI3]MCR4269095.1 NAD(P)H-binding protein [Nitratireductor sp. ZSWI3]